LFPILDTPGERTFEVRPDVDVNGDYLGSLEYVLGKAKLSNIFVELELFDNPMLRNTEAVRWDSSPFANCSASSTIWNGDVPDSGICDFYESSSLRTHSLTDYIHYIINEAEALNDSSRSTLVSFAVMNEPESCADDPNYFEEYVLDEVKDADDNDDHLLAVNYHNQSVGSSAYDDVGLFCLHYSKWSERGHWGNLTARDTGIIISTDEWGDRHDSATDLRNAALNAFKRGYVFDHETEVTVQTPQWAMDRIREISVGDSALYGPDNLDLPNAGFVLNKRLLDVELYPTPLPGTPTPIPGTPVSPGYDPNSPPPPIKYEFDEAVRAIVCSTNGRSCTVNNETYYLYVFVLSEGVTTNLFLDSNGDLHGSTGQWTPFFPDGSNLTHHEIVIPANSLSDNLTLEFCAGYLNGSTPLTDPRTGAIALCNYGYSKIHIGDGPASIGSCDLPSFFRQIGKYAQVQDVIIPFWQDGWGLHNLFSFYNHCPSGQTRTSVDVDLTLYDANGFVDSVSFQGIDGADAIHALTTGQWYGGGSKFGAAVAHITYDSAPTKDDLLSVWSMSYAQTAGMKSGFGVAVPASSVTPEKTVWEGGGVVPIPYWVNEPGTASSYFQAFNSPDSCLDAAVTFTFRTLEGTVVPTPVSMTLAPGTCGAPVVPAAALRGAGEISVSFDGIPGPKERVSLYSAVFGFVSFPTPTPVPSTTPTGSVTPVPTIQAGYSMDLKRAEPVLVEGTPVAHAFDIAIPVWQEGWRMHTEWSVHNPSSSENDVWVTIELYGSGGYGGASVATSDTRKLSPGQTTVFGTFADDPDWYQASAGFGVAYLKLEYDDLATQGTTEVPAYDDLVTVWSALYSIAPNNRRAGYQVTSPDTPIRPVNLDTNLTGHRYQGHGPGTYLQPYWAEDSAKDEHTFWIVTNSPDSDGTAYITIRIHSLDGTSSQTYTDSLDPGESFPLDTASAAGWYSLADGVTGTGEIEVSFSTSDPANRVHFWSAYYGSYLGVPLGFDIDIR